MSLEATNGCAVRRDDFFFITNMTESEIYFI